MPKILIIEDEPTLRKRLVEKFSSEGFVVSEAKDGEGGLALALAERPNIILLDIILPKMHGLEVLKKIRGNERGKTVPIIFLTNLSDGELVAKAVENGVYDFLIKKDWSLQDVVSQVCKRLGE